MIVEADKLRSFIERVERLAAERADLTTDIGEVYAEAKEQGFDTRTMRKVVQLRKLETHVRDTQDELLHSYREALGMTPIEAAIHRSFAEGEQTDVEQALEAA